jgi:uncharacterized protein (DUF302 family)
MRGLVEGTCLVPVPGVWRGERLQDRWYAGVPTGTNLTWEIDMKINLGALALFLVTCAMLVPATAVADGHEPAVGVFEMLIERQSPLGFEETLTRLEANARAAGWKVPSKWKVDFQRNLKKVTGTDIGPNRVLKMCEPHAAAKLLLKDEYKQLTAMMPCTIAVYEKSDGKTYISMMNLEAMGKMYGGDVLEMTQELGPQMEEMLNLE